MAFDTDTYYSDSESGRDSFDPLRCSKELTQHGLDGGWAPTLRVRETNRLLRYRSAAHHHVIPVEHNCLTGSHRALRRIEDNARAPVNERNAVASTSTAR